MYERETVISKLKPAIQRLAEQYPIDIAYLYGSVAAGNATPLSDIDVALVMGELSGNPLQTELSIEAELVEVCGTDRLDVRIVNEHSLVFKGEVVTHGILLYARSDDCRIDFEYTIRRLYFDFLPTLRMLQRAKLQRIKEVGLRD